MFKSKSDGKTEGRTLRGPRYHKVHPAQANPDNWKWRLVLMLTGGEIEVVPLLPLRPIYATETLIVKLGVEGALNTVEVKRTMVSELVEVADFKTLFAPDTFVAIDVRPKTQRLVGASRLVGDITGVDEKQVYLHLVDGKGSVVIDWSQIERAYWAPMGYRA